MRKGIRSADTISYNMSRIRASGSEIERVFARELKQRKIRFLRFQHKIFGKPDFIIKGKKIAVFCDSSFWHGYKFLKTKRHKFQKNKKFWIDKISGNIQRDKLVNKQLKKDGWQVLRFWDFQIKKDIHKCIAKIENILR